MGGDDSYHLGGDIFLASFNAAGEPRWVRQVGTNGPEMAAAVAVGSAGDVYVVGHTEGALDGRPSHGGWDVVLLRFDVGTGAPVWTVQQGSSGDEFATAFDTVPAPTTGADYSVDCKAVDSQGLNSGFTLPVTVRASSTTSTPTRTCCKHCGSGSTPCGDSSISTSYDCKKPAGCACY